MRTAQLGRQGFMHKKLISGIIYFPISHAGANQLDPSYPFPGGDADIIIEVHHLAAELKKF